MIRILAMAMGLILGCGDTPDKKNIKIPDPTNNPANNVNNPNNVTNNVTNNTNPNNVSELCGNGQLDPGEVCDPLAIGADRCPTECPSNLECSTITLVGNAEDCTARCEVRPVGCIDDDGCCSLGCDSITDNDCMNVCGNGIVEENETCDGNCPTTCNDGNSCTQDVLGGSPDTCNVECASVPITSCQNGDGCCPAGCTSQNDNDCVCNPTTSCQALGYTCGTLNNGCQTVNCGTCSGSQSCQDNVCVAVAPNNRVGDACTSTPQCGAGLECLTQTGEGFPGGYCTKGCFSDSECGAGAHCSTVGGDGGLCVKSCANDNQCTRSGQECYNGVGDGRLECWPVANGNGAIGTPCSSIGQCSGGQEGFCIKQATAPDFNQGYCTRSCLTNSDCGSSNAHCWRNDSGNTEGFCVAKTCNRPGYLVFNSNPEVDSLNECWPAGTGSRGVGSACEGVWQCAGGAQGLCLRPPTANLNNGYCSFLCNQGQSCPSGSTCWQSAICVDDCSIDADCRNGEGYTCGFDEVIDFCWM